MIRKTPKLFKVVSGLQKTPSLCSFIYLQLFKFACGSDTDSIVPVMLKERSNSVSLGRHFSAGAQVEKDGHFGRHWDTRIVTLRKSFPSVCFFISSFSLTIALVCMRLIISKDQKVRLNHRIV